MSRAHGGEPVPLAAALEALRMGGMRAPRAESPRADAGVEAGADAVAGTGGVALQPAAHWPDGPARVLERTDALALTDVPWDRGAVFAAVRRIADLAHLDYTRIRVVDDPAEFPVDPEAFDDLRHDECSGNPLRMGWVRHLGILADRRNVRRLRDWWASHRRTSGTGPDSATASDAASDSDAGESRSPGHVLHLYSEAGLRVEIEGGLEGIILSPVSDLVEAYVGFMLDQGAAGWDRDWHPRDGVLEEFGIDLQIGRLLSDAFCAGLGYLAVVDGEISIARRPALHLRQEFGMGGRPLFHHVSGPAIEFGDGSGLRFLEGVNFEAWLHRAIVDGALTMRYVRDISWHAARVAAYPSMPPTALLDGLDATLLDVGRTGAMLYRVENMPDHDEPVWYLVMADPSGREYGEFVSAEVGRRESADAARAATIGES